MFETIPAKREEERKERERETEKEVGAARKGPFRARTWNIVALKGFKFPFLAIWDKID